MPESQERVIVVRSESQAVPAIASFFIPGLGQLAQGRVFSGIIWFVTAVSLGVISFGLLLIPVAIFCAVDAVRFQPSVPRPRRSPLRLVLLLILLAALVGVMTLVMQGR